MLQDEPAVNIAPAICYLLTLRTHLTPLHGPKAYAGSHTVAALTTLHVVRDSEAAIQLSGSTSFTHVSTLVTAAASIILKHMTAAPLSTSALHALLTLNNT